MADPKCEEGFNKSTILSVETFTSTCSCPDLNIVKSFDKFEYELDVGALACGVGLRYIGCGSGDKKTVTVNIDPSNYEKVEHFENKNGVPEKFPEGTPKCWRNDGYQDDRYQDGGPPQSAKHTLMKQVLDNICEDAFPGPGSKCEVYMKPIKVTGGGSISVTYIRKGGDEGTSCGNTGFVIMPFSETQEYTEDQRVGTVTTTRGPVGPPMLSQEQVEVKVCDMGQFLGSGRVTIKGPSKKTISIAKTVKVTCQTKVGQAFINHVNGTVRWVKPALSGSVGAAMANHGTNIGTIEIRTAGEKAYAIAVSQITTLANNIASNFNAKISEAVDVAAVSGCAITELSVTFSISVG